MLVLQRRICLRILCLRGFCQQTAASSKRYLDVAVLGLPNTGKSVLTNALVGRSVSATSSKVNTTRNNILGVIHHDNNTQVSILDTPGILNSSFSKYLRKEIESEPSLVLGPEQVLNRGCGLMLVLVDTMFPLIHRRLMFLLHKYRTIPSILVINKTDLLTDDSRLLRMTDQLCAGRLSNQPLPTSPVNFKGKPIFSTIKDEITLNEPTVRNERLYRQLLKSPLHQLNDKQLGACFMDNSGWPHFDSVFYVSALHGHGMNELKHHLIDRAPLADWKHSAHVYTNRSQKQLALEAVRAAMLDNMPHQMPYNVRLKVLHWEEDEHCVLQVLVDCECEDDHATAALIGTNGSVVRTVAQTAGNSLTNALATQIYLRLAVRTKKQPTTTQKVAARTNKARSGVSS